MRRTQEDGESRAVKRMSVAVRGWWMGKEASMGEWRLTMGTSSTTMAMSAIVRLLVFSACAPIAPPGW